MGADLQTITNEIGVPDWSYLMAYRTNSIHEDFELFVPLMNHSDVEVVLIFTLAEDKMVLRASKENSLDHLVRSDVDREMILEQAHTVAAFNVFEILTSEKETPRYEDWFEEVFSEGFNQASNAKGFDQFHSYWSYSQPDNSAGIIASEHIYTTTVECLAPHEVEDPFGSGSIGASFWEVDIRDPRTTSTDLDPISLTTYVVLSEFKPLPIEELIIDNTVTPCVKDIIKKIKDGKFGSKLFVQILRDIFDTNDAINIDIVEEGLSAGTDGDFTYTKNNLTGSLLFNGSIRINNSYTSTASQDWILATIIHEMVHGYIAYNKERVKIGELSQAQFDRMFPLYADGADDTDHTQMAYKYVGVIADILQENNANLSRYKALALSRVGLLGNPFFSRNFSQEELDDTTKSNEIGRGTPPSTTSNSSTSTQKNC